MAEQKDNLKAQKGSENPKNKGKKPISSLHLSDPGSEPTSSEPYGLSSPSLSADSTGSIENKETDSSSSEEIDTGEKIEFVSTVFLPPSADFFHEEVIVALDESRKANRPLTLEQIENFCAQRADLTFIQNQIRVDEQKRVQLEADSDIAEVRGKGKSKEKITEKKSLGSSEESKKLSTSKYKTLSLEKLQEEIESLQKTRDDETIAPFERYKAATDLVERRCYKLHKTIKDLIKSNSVKERAKRWIRKTLEVIELTIQENKIKDQEKYKKNTLYVALSSEFAINGTYINKWVGKNGEEVPIGLTEIYSAREPIPASVEKYITKKLHKSLIKKFNRFKVIVAFSCCTYTVYHHQTIEKNAKRNLGSAAMTPQYYTLDSGVLRKADSSERKLACNNQITVLTSTSAEEKKIRSLFRIENEVGPDYLSSPNSDAYQHTGTFSNSNNTEIIVKGTDERTKELEFDLGCFGERAKKLAFLTCTDYVLDNTPIDVDIAFILSGTKHEVMNGFEKVFHTRNLPIFINDIYFWRDEKDNEYCGYILPGPENSKDITETELDAANGFCYISMVKYTSKDSFIENVAQGQE